MVKHADFVPFADDAAAMEVDGLKFENGTTCVAMFGSASFTRDVAGRQRLADVVGVLERVLKAMDASDLPEKVAGDEEASTVGNPFA